MTTPTSFSLSTNISECNVITFANGIESSSLQLSETSFNLLWVTTNGYVLPDGIVGYLTGFFSQATNTFTIGTGNQVLFWNGTKTEFSSIDKTGGNWQLVS